MRSIFALRTLLLCVQKYNLTHVRTIHWASSVFGGTENNDNFIAYKILRVHKNRNAVNFRYIHTKLRNWITRSYK
jgi:hypothetical protein